MSGTCTNRKKNNRELKFGERQHLRPSLVARLHVHETIFPGQAVGRQQGRHDRCGKPLYDLNSTQLRGTGVQLRKLTFLHAAC